MLPKLTRILLGLSLMSFSLFKESKERAFVQAENSEAAYTINFNNVSITEYLRFVSRALNMNFVFDEGDLHFNVTIVSEEPVSAKSILSTLMQVLRVHELNLVDNGDTVLITSNKAISQVAPVVSEDLLNSERTKAPLITRVFRIKNANLSTLTTIVKPLVSAGALVEVSPETKQLIVTDVAANIDNIATLLATLDTPNTSLDIASFQAKYLSTKDLVSIVTQIMTPFTEGNPFILAPQADTNTVYVVSTPHLIDRAIATMKDLDAPSKESRPMGEQGLFLYKVQNKAVDKLVPELKRVAEDLAQTPSPPTLVIGAIRSVIPIPQSHSLLFTADPATAEKLKEILSHVDTTASASAAAENTFYLYSLQYARGDRVVSQLEKLAKHLKTSSYPNTDLMQAIREIKWDEETNTLAITGSKSAIDELISIISHYDVATGGGDRTTFFIYKPVNRAPKEIEKSLQTIAADLETSGLADPDLLETVSSAKHVPLTNSILFTGSPAAIEKLKEMLATLDLPSSEATAVQQVGGLTFLIYKLKYITANQLMASLESIAGDLQKRGSVDPELIQSLNSMKYIKETNSVMFTGTQATLEKVEDLATRFDAEGEAKAKVLPEGTHATFTLYKPRYIPGEELISLAHDFEQHLIASGVKDSSFYHSIDTLKWIDKSSSVLVSGDSTSVTRVLELLQRFDSPSEKGVGPDSSIEAIDNVSFLVYKLQYHAGGEISDALRLIATEIGKNPSPSNKALAEAIKSIQWITVTNSLLVTGDENILTRLRELIANLDIPLRQVFIEMLIIETTLNNTQQFGLQWGGAVKFMNKFAGGTGNYPGVNPTSGTTSFPSSNTAFQNGLSSINATTYPSTTSIVPPPGSGFDLGVLGDIIMHKGKSFISLGSLINALQTDTDSVILLNPKLISQDNHTSTIFVGQNLPYNSSVTTVNVQAASQASTSNIEYRDIGVNISITPVLGNNDVVTLDINMDLSALLNPSEASGNFQLTGIATTHASMSTKIHVPSDNFVALSGMLNDTKAHFRTGIPCLGGLPVIGAFFSENDRTDSKDNIIVFLRPHIIDSYEDYRALTEHQEVLFKDVSGGSILKEEVDEGLDWVKLPVNEN